MKKLFVALVCILGAYISNASYLYWRIDADSDLGKVTDDWDTANIYVWDTVNDDRGDALELFGNNQQTVASMLNLGDDSGGPIGVDLGSTTGDGYTYYIELVNSETGVVGWKKVAYTDLAQGNYIQTTKLTPSSTMTVPIWHGAYNAPEPTSALLMLLGVAGLALRRKQRVA